LLHALLKLTAVPEQDLAHGLHIAEAQLNRMVSRKTGFYRPQTLQPIKRFEALVKAAREALSEPGIRRWLVEPNPYLNDVPPILCLRSDKELEKVLSLLNSIAHGFPA